MKQHGQDVKRRECTPKAAAAHFLGAMKRTATKTFQTWFETLKDGLEDCSLDGEVRRMIIEVEPIEDYYFAGVVALETSRMRKLFPPGEAASLLSEIGEQVDATAGRHDRLVSDFVFEVVGYLTGDDSRRQAMPYDDVVLHILRRLRIDTYPGTRHLLTTTLFRHQLGEPLAMGVPNWWMRFRDAFVLTSEAPLDSVQRDTPAPPAPRPQRKSFPLASRSVI
jgi:hypothetical protein